jgi:hypothetical protein
MNDKLEMNLVLNKFRMAVLRFRPEGSVIILSNQKSQFGRVFSIVGAWTLFQMKHQQKRKMK